MNQEEKGALAEEEKEDKSAVAVCSSTHLPYPYSMFPCACAIKTQGFLHHLAADVMSLPCLIRIRLVEHDELMNVTVPVCV